MDILERLDRYKGTAFIMDDINDAKREIIRLRNLLQNGSPVVEGTIQHMAMEIAEWKNKALSFEESMLMFERDADALKKELATADETNRLLNNHLRVAEERLAECERERDAARLFRDGYEEQLATVTSERDGIALLITSTKAELQDQLATVTKERDELVVALKQIAATRDPDAAIRAEIRWEIAEAALAKLGADKTGDR